MFGSSAIARSAVELAGRVVARPNVQSALAARLDSAGILLKPAEWTLIQIGSGLLAALLLLLLSGGAILAMLLGLALGLVGLSFISCSSDPGGRMRSSLSCRKPCS